MALLSFTIRGLLLAAAAPSLVTAFDTVVSPWGVGKNAPDVVPEIPLVDDPLPWTDIDAISDDLPYSNITRRAGTFYLRVMPLGASITEGVASSDGNGYRNHVRDVLRFNGWKVNMVGSKQNGRMKDRVRDRLLSSEHCSSLMLLTG